MSGRRRRRRRRLPRARSGPPAPAAPPPERPEGEDGPDVDRPGAIVLLIVALAASYIAVVAWIVARIP